MVKRQKKKYPALDPKYNLKTRFDYYDYDYIGGVYSEGEEVIRPLSSDEKAWLNKFYEETVNASFKGDDNLIKTVEKQRAIYKENNNRNACLYNILKTYKMLHFNDHNKLHELYDKYNSDNVIEQEIFNSPLNYIGTPQYIDMVQGVRELIALQNKYIKSGTIDDKKKLNKFIRSLDKKPLIKNGWYIYGNIGEPHIRIRYKKGLRHNHHNPAVIWLNSNSEVTYQENWVNGEFIGSAALKPPKKPTYSIN
jgi:hypothetical protein